MLPRIIGPIRSATSHLCISGQQLWLDAHDLLFSYLSMRSAIENTLSITDNLFLKRSNLPPPLVLCWLQILPREDGLIGQYAEVGIRVSLRGGPGGGKINRDREMGSGRFRERDWGKEFDIQIPPVIHALSLFAVSIPFASLAPSN